MFATTVAVKPAGGYRPVQAGQLSRAWECYKTRRIRLADLRAYLACQELAARRGTFNPVEIREMSRLKTAGPALSRLQSAGLISVENGVLKFPDAGGRPVPFPRRMLRHLAAGARASLIATVFGHLLRCLFLRGNRCHSGGRCKASHVSKLFDIDIRRVKAARAELVRIGWLTPAPEKQWALNRWGGVFTVNLGWPNSPPPPPPGGTTLPPPDSDQNPPPGFKDQNPPTGVSLKDVRPEDLKDTGRTLELHAQAVRANLVTRSEADRLKVVAAAEHALAVATSNAPGLFATILRGGLWKFLTQGDEDAARLRLRDHLFPRARAAPAVAPPARGPVQSGDAGVVREVLAAAARAGYKGDPFYLVRQRDPSWTRPRWEAAQREGPGASPPRAAPDPPLADAFILSRRGPGATHLGTTF